MAREVVHVISDDLDGSPDANSIQFGLDSVWYTIDLAAKNEAALRAKLEPYLEVARKTKSGASTGAKAGANRDRNMAIRGWALENGLELPSRGRIAGAVAEAYDAGDVDALYAAVGMQREPAKPQRGRRRASGAGSLGSAN